MNRWLLTPAAVLIAFFVGLASSIFLMPFWVRPFIAAYEKGNPADWIGFAGNFCVGIMTLIAAVIAWFAVQRQIRADHERTAEAESIRLEERAALWTGAKFAAVTVVTQPVHAATGVLFGIRKYLAATSRTEQARWTNVTTAAVSQLQSTLDHFSLRELSSTLAINDRLQYFMLLSRLSSIVTLFQKRPGILDEPETYRMLEKQLAESAYYMRLLDQDLANVFERDSAIK